MKHRYFKRLAAAVALMLAAAVIMTGCLPGILNSIYSEITNQSSSGDTGTKEGLEHDYYEAVNAQWMQSAVIGNGVPSINSFAEVSMQTTTDLLTILMELGDKAAVFDKGSDQRLLGDFYNSAIDYEDRDRDGLAPIMPFLDAIASVQDLSQLTDVLILMDNAGIGSFVTWDVSADLYDSTANALYIYTAYIGLPQKEYYHDTDAPTISVRSAYIRYLTKLFEQLPQYGDSAAQAAQNVLDFETALTESFWNAEQWNDVTNIYNPMTLDEISAASGKFDAGHFYEQTRIADAGTYIVACPQYLQTLGELYTDQNLEQLKQYATAMALSQASDYLTSELEAAKTEFSNAVNGSAGSLLDIERAYNTVDNYMGELLGHIYAERFFGDEAKNDVEQMVKLIIETYKRRIRSLDWMSTATKKQAIKKLDTMRVKIGFPDRWEDYSAVDIRSYDEGGSLYGNIMSLYTRLCDESLSRINRPADPDAWGMYSHTVNAYYSLSNNEIVFPAAILQAPFYDADAPIEENLGGIGSIIAHELSHAFDNNGALFDENGNYANWWTDADLTAYENKTYALVTQFDEIELASGEYINGELTLGENIADLGGLSCVVQVAKDQGGDLDTLFRAYARAWRCKSTPEYTSYLLKTDTHSPNKYRVNQVLRNIDEFYEVYGIQEDDGMYLAPEDRVRIW